MPRLENGEKFPSITASSVNHGELTVPGDLDSEWVTLLFYRGEWWPFCRQQLADYQENVDKFDELGLEVAALSVDPQEDARSVVEDIGIEYPVLYDLDIVSEAEKIGAYYDQEGGFFHATGFLLQDGYVKQLTYSSGPIGRLEPEDVAGLVEFYQSQD